MVSTLIIIGGALLALALIMVVMKSKRKDLLTGAAVLGVVLIGFSFITEPGAFTLPGADDVVSLGLAQPIISFNAFVIEDLSNSANAVNDGAFKIYDVADDPGDASVSSLVTILYSGTGGQFAKSSGVGINTNTPYRVVYNGNGSWYSHDFGIITFDGIGAFDDDTNQFDWRPAFKLQKQATIDDFLDETVAANLNGNTNTSIDLATNEIGCVGASGCSADDTIIYDESQGDGTYYIDLTFATSGSNSWVRDYSVCFEAESGAEPEGNEISSIVISSQTGSGFGLVDAAGTDNLVNFWANDLCINLGDIKAGNTEKWRFTVTVNEANLDANDDYKIVADDLGSINGKTVDIDTGVSKESADFDAQA